ncbi:MAG: AMP-binding protein [Actinomycetaceae bacterium]|nr:AMP-binding protein [Actinomycetaceae bacterium]
MPANMARAHEHYAEGVPTEITIPDITIDRLLFDSARDYPDRVAIDFLGRDYKYGELANEVERAITALYMVGVRRGDVVSVILPNCPQHYVAYFAIAAVGATVAEHNPLAPLSQLNDQIELVGSTVVIGWEKTLEQLIVDGDFKGRTYLAVNLTKALPKKSQFLLKLPIKAAREQRAKLRGNVPPGVHSWDNQVKHADPTPIAKVEGADPDDLAVLLQTGGTTGTPKAVKLSHRNVISNTMQVEAWMPGFKRGEETVGAVLPFFHAFGLQLSLCFSVQSASTIVMTPTFDVDILFAGHKRHPMTFFGGVPPIYKKILDAADERPQVDLTTIHYCVSGAMALDPELAARWERATNGYIIEGYGLSETAPVITGSPVSPDRRPSTLGIPFPSTEVKIVDQDNPERIVEPGEIGEICARGPQIFQGYLGNDEETAEVLSEDGWFRTGDLGYWDDGFVVMADRRKEMIINSGFNVYPSQVEDAVRQMPGVVDVAVVGMPTDSFSESVVAALVLEPGATVDLEAVRAWTQDKLAKYAMPKSIAILDELPRSALGKVLRRNVKERLSQLELRSGQWRERISEASSHASARVDEYLESLREKASASVDDVKAWTEENTEKFEAFRARIAERADHDGETADEDVEVSARQSGLTLENFKTWLASSTAGIKDYMEHRKDSSESAASASEADNESRVHTVTDAPVADSPSDVDEK